LQKHTARVDGILVSKTESFTPTGKPEHEVAILRWKEKNLAFFIKITEAGIAAADFYTSHVELEDVEGDPFTLEFLDVDSKLIQIKTK
jgi:hypothetical protein